jgi:antimicrobial peptide system SdpA family protein
MNVNAWASAIFIIMFWGVSIFFVAASAVAENVFNVPAQARAYQVAFVPEGWAFFTKNPRERQLKVYAIGPDSQPRELDLRGHRSNPIRSFDRSDRARLLEITKIIERSSPSDWSDCESGNYQCLQSLNSNRLKIQNERVKPEICGSHLLVLIDPVPWAWARLTNSEEMPASVLRVDVDCAFQGGE